MAYEVAIKYSVGTPPQVRGQRTFFVNTSIKRGKLLNSYVAKRAIEMVKKVAQAEEDSIKIEHLKIY